jgi:hypothetical protein
MLTTSLLHADDKAADKTERLSVPGVFSIDAPAAGFSWRTVQAVDVDAQKPGTYVAASQGKPGQVVLSVDPRKPTGNPMRVAALKAHYNSMVESLQQMGYKDLKGKQLEILKTVPDDVEYSMNGISPKGDRRFFDVHSVFGKEHIYLVQAVSTSAEDAAKLGDVAKHLKEDVGENAGKR